MTNSPRYELQLAVNDYWKEVGGLQMLPGTNRSSDRFVRASFYIHAIPQTADAKIAVPSVLSDAQCLRSVWYQYTGEASHFFYSLAFRFRSEE